jgi:hypothetical protein
LFLISQFHQTSTFFYLARVLRANGNSRTVSAVTVLEKVDLKKLSVGTIYFKMSQKQSEMFFSPSAEKENRDFKGTVSENRIYIFFQKCFKFICRGQPTEEPLKNLKTILFRPVTIHFAKILRFYLVTKFS